MTPDQVLQSLESYVTDIAKRHGGTEEGKNLATGAMTLVIGLLTSHCDYGYKHALGLCGNIAVRAAAKVRAQQSRPDVTC